MRPLRYAINVTLDGCVHHEAGVAPDEELMQFWTDQIRAADAEIYGRVTYEMMESAWRRPADGVWPDWMSEWEQPFADALDRAKKYVASSTLTSVDWNSELIQGDVVEAVRRLKEQPGGPLSVGGEKLARELTDHGLIDEYLFVVHPILAGHGPRLLDGLHERVRLELVDRREFGSGAVAHTFRSAAF
ncbi:dihydrofolate reductase family protein [Microbacterium sp. H83]|uniref:dihydrofolate reductase family protein n=1 Tax=Microbacterium sp. H83 TaxID=1827324 RepID=UPI0007F55E9D|nr:dihydrofolate reductase family protein [Microbacterium sp. H83]OAN33381.1 deaminase [Microbacterium sp. H83]